MDDHEPFEVDPDYVRYLPPRHATGPITTFFTRQDLMGIGEGRVTPTSLDQYKLFPWMNNLTKVPGYQALYRFTLPEHQLHEIKIGSAIHLRTCVNAMEAVIAKKPNQKHDLMHLAYIFRKTKGRLYVADKNRLRHVMDIKKGAKIRDVLAKLGPELQSGKYPAHFLLRTRHTSKTFGGSLAMATPKWHVRKLRQFGQWI